MHFLGIQISAEVSKMCAKKTWIVAVSIMLLCLQIRSWSQATTLIGGEVTDPSGAIVSGATVTLTRNDTGTLRTEKTNQGGYFQFSQVLPGKYDLTVVHEGFATVRNAGIDLLVDQPVTVNVALQVASASSQVTVAGESQPLLNTSDATLGNALDAQQVEDLPSLARNTTTLLSLQPGVAYLGPGTSQLTNDTRSGAVDGARSDQSNITLDGVDVNDVNNGFAFTPVLRVSQDAVSEFRVITAGDTASEGRSSGAQMALVTRSGSNHLHGMVYEYNRNNVLQANDFFVKQTQIADGTPNVPAKLIYNVFGAAVGGPIDKDRTFFFVNYEGQRQTQGAISNSDEVPTSSLRAGNLSYACVTSSTCSGSAGFLPSGISYYTLTPSQILAMDPQNIGESAAVLSLMNSLPLPNNPLVGDGLNFEGYSFIYSAKASLNAYIARLDWNITKNGKHTAFWRGNLQNDDQPTGTPTFPGQPPSERTLNDSKGFAAGYTTIFTPNLINTVEFGLTRQGIGDAGTLSGPSVNFVFTTPPANTPTTTQIVPVYDLVDSVSWSKHEHNVSAGTNIRFIENIGSNNASFPSAGGVPAYLPGGGVAGSHHAFDPSAYGYPNVSFSRTFNGRPAYNNAVLAIAGILTEAQATYNATKTGTPIPLTSPVVRDYRWNEYDFYASDTWKVAHNLTLTYGLHYTYQQVPAEVTGTQVGICLDSGGACAPGNFSLTSYLKASAAAATQGLPANQAGELGFPLDGRYNGKPDYWTPDKADFAPRLAIAFSPAPRSGIMLRLLGRGATSIRAGYALTYNHFGAGVVNSYNSAGSYGLSTSVQTSPGTFNAGNAPRYVNLSTVPSALLPAAPTVTFPGIPAASGPASSAIAWAEDSAIRTPYSHAVDLSITREVAGHSSLEIDYVGRFSHRLPEQEDVAMPTNLAAAGSTYYAAAQQMSSWARANTSMSSIPTVAYWQTLFAPLAGQDIGCGSGLTATQNVYCVFQGNVYNETNALYSLDMPDSITGAGVNPSQLYPSYRFYHDQYSSLYAWRSVGNSNFNALQVVFRQRFGLGLHGDFNYSYSKSLDISSQAERESVSGINNGSQIINTWIPNQLYGVSDFDMHHQISGDYIWNLPVGRGMMFASSVGRLTDELIGGWQTTGIIRWTSGLPFEVVNGSNWPTNWNIAGYATQIATVPQGRGQLQQRFSNPSGAYAAFDHTYPGDSGTRNPLRGDGYFEIDGGAGKTFGLTERLKLKLGLEVFNLSNSVRFDPKTISANLDDPNTFGFASQTLTSARKAQFYGRFEF
jgi:hypothetical protein